MYKRKMNEQGGIEGLPLQMIIMVIITALAIAVIVAWFVQIENNSISACEVRYEEDQGAETTQIVYVSEHKDKEIYIYVYDQDDKLLPNALVMLDGAGVETEDETDSNGVAKLKLVGLYIPEGSSSSHISIHVEKNDYGSWDGTLTVRDKPPE